MPSLAFMWSLGSLSWCSSLIMTFSTVGPQPSGNFWTLNRQICKYPRCLPAPEVGETPSPLSTCSHHLGVSLHCFPGPAALTIWIQGSLGGLQWVLPAVLHAVSFSSAGYLHSALLTNSKSECPFHHLMFNSINSTPSLQVLKSYQDMFYLSIKINKLGFREPRVLILVLIFLL